jgi:bifunctional non-homologous end joining protein LigD
VKSKAFQFECVLRGALPPVRAKFLDPMLCRAARVLPESDDWQYEIKLDGYRAIAVKSGGRVELWSRNRKDFSRRFSRVVDALAEILDETVIDGEIVALDGGGLPAFHRLQNFDGDQSEIVFYAFDLPIFGGLDLRRQPLETRRDLLRETIALLPDAVRYSETFDVAASRLMQVVREKGLEGIVAKRRGSSYQAKRRSDDWIKVRANQAAEFVIGGYVPSARSFDTILVERFEGGAFMYVGSVRTGFAPGARQSMLPDFVIFHADRRPL